MIIRIALMLVACLLLTGFTSCQSPADTKAGALADLDASFERRVLVIEADDGVGHEFDVYLAVTDEQKRRGLMFVRELPDRSGMLFIYDDSNMQSMWMKNTYISLDLVFARSDGTVSSIIREAQPLSLQPLSSVEPVSLVLELNAGTTRRYKIGRGSRLVWKPEAESQHRGN